jgi:16S rRNA (guanine1207-N2)-methyltransferase
MHAAYGMPPAGLVAVPAGAVQCSPLVPGSAAIEDAAVGAFESIVMLAPRATLERRFAVAHALRALRPAGLFTVLAAKKLGGARLRDELQRMGCCPDEVSRQHHRICTCRRPEEVSGLDEAIRDGGPRFIEAIGMWSQPGIFSWDRVDAGSALLIGHLPSLSGRGADLGCGIGVLSKAVLVQTSVTHITLIDIDRRAIEAARRNLEPSRCSLLWADLLSMQARPQGLDFVVMNPPFHDGGSEDQDLGRAFIRHAAGMLRAGGICLLTANRHLPYEAAMKPLFSTVTLLAQDDGFKVYSARK